VGDEEPLGLVPEGGEGLAAGGVVFHFRGPFTSWRPRRETDALQCCLACFGKQLARASLAIPVVDADGLATDEPEGPPPSVSAGRQLGKHAELPRVGVLGDLG